MTADARGANSLPDFATASVYYEPPRRLLSQSKPHILDNTLVGFAKGGLYENAIAEQLVSRSYVPYYHQKSPWLGEIDFVIEHKSGAVPIEVKTCRNTSSSFDAMLKRDDVAFGYKFITDNVGRVGKKITLPHYMSMVV